MPVNPSFYAPTGSTRTFAFSVQQDPALQSGIPFVRNQAGGSLPNAAVSPFLIVSPAATGFGDVATASTRGLQGSLAISGQGANQQSAVAVSTGVVGQQQANGQPIFLGEMRGSSQLSAFSPPVRLSSAVSSTVDGANNSFYGGNSISGFVLDQTRYNNTAPGSGIIPTAIIPSTASEVQLTGAATSYGFAQPALPTGLPAGIGTTNPRNTQTITGNAGGLNFTSAQGQPYIVAGPISISTDAGSNQIAATISATAQTPSSGYNTLTYQFGSGTQGARQSAFIDDRNFAAVENRQNPQQANGQTLVVNGDPSQAGQLYLVNANTAPPPASLLLAGAAYCQCQFLQWGYWGGDLLTGNSTDSTISRVDRAHINFWAAGVPTPQTDLNTLAAQGAVGTYAGHAIGSVSNNGASYVAGGGFNGSYNFGTRAAAFTISNFDGNTLTAAGTVPLSGANYTMSGTAARTGMTGTFNGSFYGPLAAETGGSFTLRSTIGAPYMASGIYAGKR